MKRYFIQAKLPVALCNSMLQKAGRLDGNKIVFYVTSKNTQKTILDGFGNQYGLSGKNALFFSEKYLDSSVQEIKNFYSEKYGDSLELEAVECAPKLTTLE